MKVRGIIMFFLMIPAVIALGFSIIPIEPKYEWTPKITNFKSLCKQQKTFLLEEFKIISEQLKNKREHRWKWFGDCQLN